MATEKIVNYTEAMTKELVEAYVASPTEATVKAFAEKFGRTTRSIVAKLAAAKVYVSKTKAGTGVREATKAEMVKEIASYLELPEADLESFEKASVPALKATLKALKDFMGE